MSKYNFDNEISGWTAFIEKCKQRVKDDERELSQTFNKEIKCRLMRSPEICPKPSYILLGMEPTISEKVLAPEEICYFPLFLRYCIYKYLCKEKFEFHITDLAKGSMLLKPPVEDAVKRKIQNYRYQKWLPLFIEEWELLGKPKIIAIGKGVYDILRRANIDNIEYVEHYSLRNDFSKLLEHYQIDYQPNETTIINEIKDFWAKFGNHLNTERHNQSDSDINFPLGEGRYKSHNMQVIFVYRYYFEQLLCTGKIPHKNDPKAVSSDAMDKLLEEIGGKT